MGKWKDKECKICGKTFTPTGPCAKYCEEHRAEGKRQNARRGTQAHRMRKAVEDGNVDRIGIGRGGGQKTGEDSPHFKTGISYFKKRRIEIRDEVRYCERCDKDLKDVGRYDWCVHHKDHDRTNNTDENFELLCKRCHQLEHECQKALEGATTISKESTPKRVEAEDIPRG